MELNMQNPKENPRVIRLINIFEKEYADLMSSLEYNSKKSNLRWFDGMRETLIEVCEGIELVEKENEGREKFNLSELITKRNKLNREISTLKKATLQN